MQIHAFACGLTSGLAMDYQWMSYCLCGVDVCVCMCMCVCVCFEKSQVKSECLVVTLA